jgi:hypothetical protein
MEAVSTSGMSLSFYQTIQYNRGHPSSRAYIGNVGIDGMIILKCNLKKFPVWWSGKRIAPP